MPTVLITGARAPAALELARAFARVGWRVLTADTFRWTVCSGSKAVSRHIQIPSPRTDFSGFCLSLERITVDLIVPTCEEVFYLAAWDDPRVFAPQFDLLKQLHSKWEFLGLAAGCGVEIPETRLLNVSRGPGETRSAPQNNVSSGELEGGSTVAKGLVFKREFSRFGTSTFVERLPPTTEQNKTRWIVQEKLTGQEFSSYGIAVDGKVTAFAFYEPMWRIRGAASVCFRALQDEQALDFAQTFAAKTSLTGQFGFDFIRTSRGLFVLECNPRATSGVHLLGGLGLARERPAEMPELANAFQPPGLAGQQPIVNPFKERCVKAAMLLADRGPTFWSDFWSSPDVISVREDRGPALGLVAHLAEVATRAVIRRQTLQQAATHDIEWDGEPIGVV